jgi:putative transposase
MFKTSAQLRLENLALRQQLIVLRRSAPKRLKLTRANRIFWVWLRRVWGDWRSALMIVKAETVITWHRKGFRLFWTWRIRRGKPGRPKVPQEIRDLIRMLSRNNPGWDAPRIHGELLKLGIEITEPTVAKYMCDIANRLHRLGGRSLTIMSRRWCRWTSLPFRRSGSRSSTCFSSWRMTADESCTLR